ncbi:prepilin-type cleavage/methylation domain-containing protein [Acinetobacter schindleri]|uniref:Prepilin-type cleavage/methylation domain-containing protein n=2 Tax=Acinetobacter schindleri TaxID=108981 RepID=A0AAE7BYR6_9GAMM|nr:prepilin-type cleavage/methylation domain-containing protein [Acinetobacter schindleri]
MCGGGGILMNKNNAGYTLVELIIALLLGVIIIGAAFYMLLSGQKSLTFQQAMANVQDNANIGLSFIVGDIKHANLNLLYSDMRNNRVSGLIVDNANYPSNITTGRVVSTAANLASPSLTNIKSDVLVVQYKPNKSKSYDCEGGSITSSDEIVIQKYFLRRDTNGASHDYSLACDAGRYNKATTATSVTGLDGSGQILMQRVDQFKVLVGVKSATGNMSYMTLSQFASAPATSKAVSIQIGLLVRSADSVNADTNEQLVHDLLGTPNTIAKPAAMKSKYLWVPVEQTIALRNGLGEGL